MIASTQTSPENVERRLAICLPEIHIDRTRRPSEQPIDSLDLVAFLCAIDQEFGVRLSPEEFQNAESFDDLYGIIAARGTNMN